MRYAHDKGTLERTMTKLSALAGKEIRNRYTARFENGKLVAGIVVSCHNTKHGRVFNMLARMTRRIRWHSKATS